MKKFELRQIIREEYQRLIEDNSNYEVALNKFIAVVNNNIINYTKKHLKNLYDSKLYRLVKIKRGRRFDKIIKYDLQTKKPTSVYCFVERKTGDIYKAAGYNAPAKGARASIFEPKSYQHADSSGGWLYK